MSIDSPRISHQPKEVITSQMSFKNRKSLWLTETQVLLCLK